MTTDSTKRRRRNKPADETKEAGQLTISMSRTMVKEVIDDEEVTRELEVETFVTDPAHVEIHAGITRKLEEFESLRIDVTIRVPCYKEQIGVVADDVAQQVSDILNNEVDTYFEEEGLADDPQN